MLRIAFHSPSGRYISLRIRYIVCHKLDISIITVLFEGIEGSLYKIVLRISIIERIIHLDYITLMRLQLLLEEISYRALPDALVDKVEVDLDGVKVGDSILVKDLALAKNPDIELLTDPEAVVVSVTESHTAAEETDEEETAAE